MTMHATGVLESAEWGEVPDWRRRVALSWLDGGVGSGEKQAMARTERTDIRTLLRELTFEEHNIGAQLDANGRYALPFQREFPLSVRLFHFCARRFTQGMTWHEQLELFCPVSGTVEVKMGDQLVSLDAGDLLVMDNLKLHHVVDRPGLDARVIVVSFLPELVYTLGSSSHDFAFLLPFYTQVEARPHVVRASEPVAAEVREALLHLVREFSRGPADGHREAGCKARLLALLILLVRRFHDAAVARREFDRRRQLAQRLSPVLAHVQTACAERLSLAQAARTCGMSLSQFTRAFRQTAGMSFVAYVTRIRLAEAARMLRAGDRKIAEVAGLTGFADQSHFDRRFKRAFGQTPRDYQRAAGWRG